MKLKDRLFNLALSVDQTFNVILGSGYSDETLSAYAHRKQGWRRTMVNSIFFWQLDHCLASYESELNRKHLPRVYSNGT